MYGTGLTTEFIVLFIGTVRDLENSIGYSPYCKTKILIQMIRSARRMNWYCMTNIQQDEFEETIRKAYLE